MSRGEFLPDDDMKRINAMLEHMHLLADSGDGRPYFYFNPADQSYWECVEYDDYTKELTRVDRRHIELEFPTVDPDRWVT